MAEKISVKQFGQRIKQNFPQYNDMDDFDLGSRMLGKYPVYKDLVMYDARLDPEAKKIIAEGQKAQEFLSKSKPAQITEAFIKTLPETAYEFLLETPLKFTKSVIEAVPTLVGQKTPNLGGYVSQAKQELQQGATPFGYKAFVKPAVGTAVSGLATLGLVKGVSSAVSKVKSLGAEKTALQQTMSPLNKKAKIDVFEKSGKPGGVVEKGVFKKYRVQPTTSDIKVAQTAQPYIVKNNPVKSIKNINNEISRVSQKEVFPYLKTNKKAISSSEMNILKNQIKEINPADEVLADPVKNNAFKLMIKRVLNRVSNAKDDLNLYEKRIYLDQELKSATNGKIFDDTGMPKPAYEAFKEARRIINNFITKRLPQGETQFADKLARETDLFLAREGVALNNWRTAGTNIFQRFAMRHPVIIKAGKYGAIGIAGALIGKNISD